MVWGAGHWKLKMGSTEVLQYPLLDLSKGAWCLSSLLSDALNSVESGQSRNCLATRGNIRGKHHFQSYHRLVQSFNRINLKSLLHGGTPNDS